MICPLSRNRQCYRNCLSSRNCRDKDDAETRRQEADTINYKMPDMDLPVPQETFTPAPTPEPEPAPFSGGGGDSGGGGASGDFGGGDAS